MERFKPNGVFVKIMITGGTPRSSQRRLSACAGEKTTLSISAFSGHFLLNGIACSGPFGFDFSRPLKLTSVLIEIRHSKRLSVVSVKGASSPPIAYVGLTPKAKDDAKTCSVLQVLVPENCMDLILLYSSAVNDC